MLYTFRNGNSGVDINRRGIHSEMNLETVVFRVLLLWSATRSLLGYYDSHGPKYSDDIPHS